MGFYVWIDEPTAGTNVMAENTFAADSQRENGFQAGQVASSIRMNTALRQSTLVTAALMKAMGLDNLDYTEAESTVQTQIENKLSAMTVMANPAQAGVMNLTKIKIGGTIYNIPSGGTNVVANPTLSGTEASLTGLQVGSTKYKLLEEKSGSGNLVDSSTSGTVGTYDYVQIGKMCTITLHIPNSIASIGLSLILDGLDPLASGYQQFGYVQNSINSTTTNLVCVSFFIAANKSVVQARVGGSAYVSNFTFLDRATFTVRMA